MFSSLLVANRGEIARRVMRTAARLGIETIAVYSDADRDAPFAREADRALRIGPAPPAESYLRIDAILEAAARSGAEAVHPGYGFLAESADFAQACADAGLVFVGPPPDAIRALGLKDRAKAIAAAAGAPVIPGYDGADQSEGALRAAADGLGYPLLVKAVAGGGGMGMRRVGAPGDLTSAVASARREAKAAFGDDRVLLEKLVAPARHVEVQVFGDAHGRVIHLFERDCSLQRRRQKVIEEAPAPGMTSALRAAMCGAAVAVAKAAGYVNAGTVEFIVDARSRLRADGFWFMEMNTRLQVEHPVTEMVTGLDLVEMQLRVAAGEPLPAQEEIALDGHAIEARVYAEDPAQGFLPSVGALAIWDFSPVTDEALGGGVQADAALRLDSGVEQGDVLRSVYDPLLAKAIVHADARDDAAFVLASALGDARAWPVKTNLGFLVRALRHPDFLARRVNTGFVDDHLDALAAPAAPEDAAGLAAICEAIEDEAAGEGARDPWDAGDAWRLNGPPRSRGAYEVEGRRLDAMLTDDGAAVTVRVGGRERRVEIGEADVSAGEGEMDARLDGGRALRIGFERAGGAVVLFVDGDAVELRPPGDDPGAAAAEAGDEIRAPLPGRVQEVRIAAGDRVEAGDVAAVLEAMKMEHALRAPRAGIVASVEVRAGDQVAAGAVLARLAAG